MNTLAGSNSSADVATLSHLSFQFQQTLDWKLLALSPSPHLCAKLKTADSAIHILLI